MEFGTRANMMAALPMTVMTSSGAFGATGDLGPGNVGRGAAGAAAAEPRLFAPFNADISASIQNGKNALGSPQNSLTFLINVLIAVGRPISLKAGCVNPSSACPDSPRGDSRNCVKREIG